MKRYFFVFASVLCLHASFSFLAGSYFEVTDNVAIQWLLKGTYNEGGINIFPRFLLGYSFLLNWLYHYIPNVPWFGVFLGIAYSLSATNCIYYLGRLLKIKKWIIFIPTVYLIAFLYGSLYIDFSLTGILLCSSGVLLLFLKEKRIIWTAYISILCGAAIRYQVGLSALVLLPIFILNNSNIHWKRILISCSIILFVLGSFHLITTVYFKEYQKENKLKSHYLDYEKNLDKFEDETLTDLYGHWYFNDTNIKQTLVPKLAQHKKPSVLKKLSFDRLYQLALDTLRKQPFWPFLFLIAVFTFNKKELCSHFYLVFLLIGLSLMFKTPPRILFAITTVTIFSFITSISTLHKTSWSLFGYILAISFSIFLTQRRVDFGQKIQYTTSKQLNLLTSQTNQLLVFDVRTFKRFLNPYTTYETGRITPLTGWHSNLPQLQKNLQSTFGAKHWNEIFSNNKIPNFSSLFFQDFETALLFIDYIKSMSNYDFKINRDYEKNMIIKVTVLKE